MDTAAQSSGACDAGKRTGGWSVEAAKTWGESANDTRRTTTQSCPGKSIQVALSSAFEQEDGVRAEMKMRLKQLGEVVKSSEQALDNGRFCFFRSPCS